MADNIFADALGGGTGAGNYFADFARSAISSIPEMFGARPMDGVEQFRADNPISGFASELAGIAVPSGAWFKVSQLPRYAATLDALALGRGAFVGGGLKEIARWAP